MSALWSALDELIVSWRKPESSVSVTILERHKTDTDRGKSRLRKVSGWSTWQNLWRHIKTLPSVGRLLDTVAQPKEDMAREQPKIVIIGGGVAGIAATKHLLHGGLKNICVLEAKERLGGRIDTIPHGKSWSAGQRTKAYIKSLFYLGIAQWPKLSYCK